MADPATYEDPDRLRELTTTHDEVKDKMFELELSWVADFTGSKHERVPDKVLEEAEKLKAELEEAGGAVELK